jgi:hypothetical protein
MQPVLARKGPPPGRLAAQVRAHALWALGPFLLTRAAIFSIGWLSLTVLAHGFKWRTPNGLLDAFVRWDADWFLGIVRNGYSYTPGHESPVAFFPLYPMLVRALAAVGVPDITSGFIVSNTALYVAAVLCCALWTSEYRSVRIGRAGVVLLLVWPASFFHSTLYSDALFLALLAGALLLARAGRWFYTSVLGALLVLTRPVGVLVLVPLVLEAWGIGLAEAERPRRAGVAWLAVIPLTRLGYAAYEWRRFGDALASVHVLPVWGRDMAGVAATFARAHAYVPFYRAILEGSAFWLAGLILLMPLARSRPSNTAWCAIVWYTSAASGTLEAFPRLTMMALPIFGFVAAWTDRRPTAFQLVVAVSAMFLGLMTSLFVCGYWMT